MTKIPTLFKRGGVETNYNVIPELTPGCEWVLEGRGVVSIKIDGVCVKVQKDEHGVPRLFRRLKPADAAYSEASFVPCSREDPSDKHLYAAFDNESQPSEGIYEAFGPNIQGNPQGSKGAGIVKVVPVDGLLMLGSGARAAGFKRGAPYTVQDMFDSIKDELGVSEVEGIVFHLEEPAMKPIAFAKVKRKDFGFKWPI